ncbi:Peroxisomal biogenesis factor 19 [Trichoplax sp. H2]|nr:Peroxisomal biogenesis factor 19 [Trichoplax sp. H2]|eukprot:RDD40900.1 Peroxisomal biogenesis factor 19 [Trichoplax sp. H2]
MASSERTNVVDQSKTDEDPELDSLLDSALQDFDSFNIDNTPEKGQTNQIRGVDASDTSTPASAATMLEQGNMMQGEMQNWNTALNDQMMAEMEKVMQEIMSSEEGKKLMSNLEGMAKMSEEHGGQASDARGELPSSAMGATIVSTDSTDNSNRSAPASTTSGPAQLEDVDGNLAQILQGLADNAEALKQPVDSFNFGSSPEDIEKLLPAMQGMMENLLAKDVVYPSVKETTAKYTVWLQENQGKIEPEAYNKYCQQYDLMREICCEYESEQPDDSQELKRQRFDRLTDLMNKMHDYGQPPTDIVGNVGMGVEFDENGQIKLPPNMRPEECSLM